MKEWRQAHPRATLRKIEEAVMEQMSLYWLLGTSVL